MPWLPTLMSQAKDELFGSSAAQAASAASTAARRALASSNA